MSRSSAGAGAAAPSAPPAGEGEGILNKEAVERAVDAAVRALPLMWQRGAAQKDYERDDVRPIVEAVAAALSPLPPDEDAVERDEYDHGPDCGCDWCDAERFTDGTPIAPAPDEDVGKLLAEFVRTITDDGKCRDSTLNINHADLRALRDKAIATLAQSSVLPTACQHEPVEDPDGVRFNQCSKCREPVQ